MHKKEYLKLTCKTSN